MIKNIRNKFNEFAKTDTFDSLFFTVKIGALAIPLIYALGGFSGCSMQQPSAKVELVSMGGNNSPIVPAR